MAIEMKKTRVKMTKTIFIGMSTLDISKILMYELWYDYIEPKYGDRAKLCYTILIALLFTLKPKIFLKMFPMMLRDGLIYLTAIKMIKDGFQQVKIKKYQVFLKMN